MTDESTIPPAPAPKKSKRRILWFVLGGLLVLIFVNALLSEVDLGSGDRIALVRVEGVIMDARDTVEELKKFGKSSSVKAIVLRIDSPGGGVVPSQEIHDAVMRVRHEHHKTVVASMGTVAASGGYYIAVATDRIMANPGTLTGSIGVIMELANVEGLLNKIGVESMVVKSGRYKDIGSPFRKMGPEDRRVLQAVMDDVHTQFIEAVADGRSLEVEAVRSLADGRIFTGRQAKDVKLVDELGDLDDAIHTAANLVGIQGEPKVVEPRKRFSFRDLLESQLGDMMPKLDFQPGVRLKYLMAF